LWTSTAKLSDSELNGLTEAAAIKINLLLGLGGIEDSRQLQQRTKAQP